MTRFGRWYRLQVAAAHAPPGPGVFQVRLAHGLVVYPTGRSAMVHYEASADLPGAVRRFAQLHEGRDWLCRFAEDLSARDAADPDGMVAGLLASFRRRFGAPPGTPS
jgi:hypothetical protein